MIGTGQAFILETWRAVLTECLPPNYDLVVMARSSERALRIAASLYAFDLIVLFPNALMLDNRREDRFDRTLAMVRHLRAMRDAALVVVMESRPRGYMSQLEQAGVHAIVEQPCDPALLPAIITSALETRRNAEENPVALDLEELPALWTPRKGYAPKPDYTMLIGLDHFAGMITLLAGMALGAKRRLRFFYFQKSSELLELAESEAFDGAFMYLGNIKWDRRAEDGSWLGAAGVLAELHAKHDKPIVVTQLFDLESEYMGTGVSFLPVPLTLESLQRCLPDLHVDWSDQSPAGQKSFEVAVVGAACGIENLFLSLPLEELLGPEYQVTLHYYHEVNDWEQCCGTPDLVVLYLNPALQNQTAEEVEPQQAIEHIRTKSQMPILLLTNEANYGLEWTEQFVAAGAAGMFCFLPPFPTVAFVDLLGECVKCRLQQREQKDKKD